MDGKLSIFIPKEMSYCWLSSPSYSYGWGDAPNIKHPHWMVPNVPQIMVYGGMFNIRRKALCQFLASKSHLSIFRQPHTTLNVPQLRRRNRQTARDDHLKFGAAVRSCDRTVACVGILATLWRPFKTTQEMWKDVRFIQQHPLEKHVLPKLDVKQQELGC